MITESGVLPVNTKLRCLAALTNAPSSATSQVVILQMCQKTVSLPHDLMDTVQAFLCLTSFFLYRF